MKAFDFKKIFRKNWQGAAVFILAVVFFISAGSYNYLTQGADYIKWSSPDEQANYVFTKLYAQTGELAIFEKYNIYLNDIMHPRSFRSDAGSMKPVSFLGIILIYGTLAKLISIKIIPYLTPLFGALGLIYYYLFIKKIFGKNNAFLSAWLLFGFPVWLYYGQRSMFHNVLFVSLLIIGLYYLIIGSEKLEKDKFFAKPRLVNLKNWLYVFLAGIFLGLAVITRASELLWLAPLLLVLWLMNMRRFGLMRLFVFLSVFSLAVLPMFYYNTILYGYPLNGGYAEMNTSIQNIAQAGEGIIISGVQGNLDKISGLVTEIKNNIFHFGIDARQSAKMFYFYFAGMFTWLFILAGLGFILFTQKIKKWRKKHFVYIIRYVLISVILVIYYGSWEFFDNPDRMSHTIGNSYTRYWLPIYLGAMPLASLFISRLTKAIFPPDLIKVEPIEASKYMGWFWYMGKKHLRRPRASLLVNGLTIIIIALIIFRSVNFLLIGSDEGVVFAYEKSRQAKEEYAQVLELTENNAVIVTQFHDKLFFPERKVIVGLLNDEAMNRIYAQAVKLMPVYYYNFRFPPESLVYLNDKKLKESGLQITEVKRINKDFTLYKFYPNR